MVKERFDVVLIDVCVPHHVDELTWIQSSHFSYPTGKERVACDVERDPQSNITASLVEQTTQSIICDIKLEQDMTWR